MKRRRYFIITLILIFALVLAGCSSAKDSADITTNTAVSSGTISSSTSEGSTVKNSAVDKYTSESEKTTDSPSGSYEKPVSTSAPASESIGSDIRGYSDSYLESSKAAVDGGSTLEGFYSTADAYVGVSDEAYDRTAKEYAPGVYDGADYYDGEYSTDDYLPDDVIIWDPEYPYDPTVPVDPYDPYLTPTPLPQATAGLLTAGEWNDNRNFDFLKGLISDGQNFDYKTFFTNWNLSPFNRLVITSTDSQGKAGQGADVTVTDANGNPIWKGVTDHTGTVFAYYALLDADMMPSKVHAEMNGESADYEVTSSDMIDTATIALTLNAQPKAKTLDLMFTVDTTGSMGDEIYYLQAELQDVIKRVQNDTANIPVRLSVNFYRDVNDDYVVRPYEFSSNINEQLAYLNREYANGGGDFEEAVEQALENSVKDHAWDEDSIKLLFLVLDAPPHNTPAIRESLRNTLSLASEKGIRIIPVASSGIDKDTEFILRAFAMTTGGTYTFLTDDSGIGGSHIEPTVGDYEVEQLNDLLVRIIEEYIG